MAFLTPVDVLDDQDIDDIYFEDEEAIHFVPPLAVGPMYKSGHNSATLYGINEDAAHSQSVSKFQHLPYSQMFCQSQNQSPQDHIYPCASQEWDSADELLEHALDQELDSDYDYDLDLDLELEFDLDPGEEVFEEEYDDGYDGVDFFPGLMDAASPFGQEINAHTLQSADLDFGGQHLEDVVEQLQNVRSQAAACLEGLALSFLAQLASLPNSQTHTSNKEHASPAEITQNLPDEIPISSDDGNPDNSVIPFRKPNKGINLSIASRRTLAEDSDGTPQYRTIQFPARSKKSSSAPRFAVLFRVIDLAHEALVSNVPTTKRDIFYKDVPLFGKQSTVDHLVDDIAATFRIPRSSLNIRASSKGLFCGASLSLHLKHGGVVSGDDNESTLIPAEEDISWVEIEDSLEWVLVVEKEAVFQTLARIRFAAGVASHLGPGVIITGKGYPDLATRSLVHRLCSLLAPTVPVLALVDGDAYGIDILSVYKFGSTSLQHQRDALVAPRLEWIGVHGSELANIGVDKDALIPLTTRDHSKAMAMLRRPRAIMPDEWRRELTHMLHMRRKAEIECLVSASSVPQYGVQGVRDSVESSGPWAGPGRADGNKLVEYLVWKIAWAASSARC